MQNQRLSLKLKYRFSSSSSYFSMLFWERSHEKHNKIWINICTGYIDTPKFLKVKSGAPDMSRETSDQTPKEELRWQSRQPTKLLCLTWTDDIKKRMDVIYEKKLCNACTKLKKKCKNVLIVDGKPECSPTLTLPRQRGTWRGRSAPAYQGGCTKVEEWIVSSE